MYVNWGKHAIQRRDKIASKKNWEEWRDGEEEG